MSRNDDKRAFSTRNRGLARVLFICFACACTPVLSFDVVTLADGSEFEGRVLSLDLDRLELEFADGERKFFRRAELVSIEFSNQPAPTPIRVAVRVLGEDDEVQLFLDDVPIATPAQLSEEWVDIGDRLAEGSNRIRGEVTNGSGLWAYRWVLDVAGQRYTFACGLPRKSGCKRDGASGTERGKMPAGAGWIYVHRADGTVEVEQE